MAIRNGGNVQAINKFSHINNNLEAVSTLLNIYHFKIQCSFSVCINIET